MSGQGIESVVDIDLQPIETTQALAELQALLGQEVMVNVAAEHFGVVFISVLERAETLGTDDVSIMLHFSEREAVNLDPELRVFLGTGPDGDPRWLEFWDSGPVPSLTIHANRVSPA